jgi:hypothetical protein
MITPLESTGKLLLILSISSFSFFRDVSNLYIQNTAHNFRTLLKWQSLIITLTLRGAETWRTATLHMVVTSRENKELGSGVERLKIMRGSER